MNRLSIGVDIGGTNTVGGIVDEEGNILAEFSFSTKAYPVLNEYLDVLSEHVNTLKNKAENPAEIVGLGVGAPNGNFFNGTIEFAPNLPWQGIIKLREELRARTQLKVIVTNDANAAAIGEMKYGVARDMNDFILITLGTGLGSGIVTGGKLLYGHDGFAGELGHTIVDYDGRICGCGRKGCLETYASATGIVQTMKELMMTSEQNVNSEYSNITSKDITTEAIKGNPLAIKAFDITALILGRKLADAVAFSSPEAIILFGGLANSGDLLLIPLIQYFENSLLQIYKNKVRILLSGLPENSAAILGAAALPLE